MIGLGSESVSNEGLMNERLTSTSDFSPAPIPVRHQPQPSLKGQFCFISSEEEDSPSGLYPFSHTKPPPNLGAVSPLLPIHRPLSTPPSPSTPYAALPLASQNPKARPSAVGARAEHQAEGAEPGACLLQF